MSQEPGRVETLERALRTIIEKAGASGDSHASKIVALHRIVDIAHGALVSGREGRAAACDASQG